LKCVAASPDKEGYGQPSEFGRENRSAFGAVGRLLISIASFELMRASD
jgi:hypothetical protein